MIRYYDVHGLLRVSSNVALPELEYFATPDRDDQPDIEVRVRLRGAEPAAGSRFVSISDLPGRIGFAADIERTATILAGITGSRPGLFRACTWSVTRRTPWAPALLAQSGIRDRFTTSRMEMVSRAVDDSLDGDILGRCGGSGCRRRRWRR